MDGSGCPPPKVFTLKDINKVLETSALQIIDSIAEGFVAYSKGECVVAPVIHLGGDEQPLKGGGDCCIKCGFLNDDDFFVVKIAPGSFAGNAQLGIPTNTGLMLVFSSRTGMLECILLDEGILTELRTAACGAIAARLLGPKTVRKIGIVGTGIQARYQVDMLQHVTPCREVVLWGRNQQHIEAMKSDLEAKGVGWKVTTTKDMKELASSCNLIVTVTTAREALLKSEDIQPGTHITCVGADGNGKQELDPTIFSLADLVVADSKKQCTSFGEISHGIHAKTISENKVMEFGELIASPTLHRKGMDDDRITVLDSAGVAVQDVQIAKMVFQSLTSLPRSKL
ncbi:hypothetical protein CYMTET_20888 [Cymbomonas tetramitiformis]|uniref:Ornithine cyclodeaminase n=1 Tax=Cymbomonas tetramitiformis TaxID=36881 RepID=A0AAE0G3N2_9CHLO|nr:hypothetical protein CYMTET_20888 [Cymbomonas tetramitiformis]